MEVVPLQRNFWIALCIAMGIVVPMATIGGSAAAARQVKVAKSTKIGKAIVLKDTGEYAGPYALDPGTHLAALQVTVKNLGKKVENDDAASVFEVQEANGKVIHMISGDNAGGPCSNSTETGWVADAGKSDMVCAPFEEKNGGKVKTVYFLPNNGLAKPVAAWVN
jgi:hypothetical protein